MKTLHANKDYVLHNGHIHILKNEVSFFATWNTGDIIATTDKSLPLKHIDRSVFVKPVDVGQIFDNNFDCYADTWQGDAESMHAGDVVPAMTKDKFVEILIKTRHNTNMPLSLPETIQCDDNYENLKPIW